MANTFGASTLETDIPTDISQHAGACPTGGIMEAVKDKAKEVASGASDLMSGARDKVQEWASDAADAAGVVKEKTQEFATVAVHKAEAFGEGLTNLMRRYPIPTLLVGFGIGILAARMMRRD
jgi:hypothetical protein